MSVEKIPKRNSEGLEGNSDSIVENYAEEGSGEKLEATDEEMVEPSLEGMESEEELAAELADARREYVQKDYEMDKNSSKFKKILGIDRLGEYEEETEIYERRYQNALQEYKEFKSKEGKESSEDLARWLISSESLDRENIRAELEAEDKKDGEKEGWTEKISKGFTGMVDKYKKLSWKQKLATGVGIAGASVLAGAAGAAGATGALVWGSRALSMAVSSTGFAAMFEARAQKKKEEKTEKEIKESAEMNGEKVNEFLDDKIKNINSEIQKEKRGKVWRRWAGVLTGAAVSATFMHLGREIVELVGDSEVAHSVMEKIKGLFESDTQVVGSGEGLNYDNPSNWMTGKTYEAIKDKSLENFLNDVGEYGKSIEGSDWEGYPGFKQYQKLAELITDHYGSDIPDNITVEDFIKSNFEGFKAPSVDIDYNVDIEAENIGNQAEANPDNFQEPLKNKPEISAQDSNMEGIENMSEAVRKERAIGVLDKIFNLPDQSEYAKEKVVRALVNSYAAEGKNGLVSPEAVKNALEELKNYAGDYADRKLSNNDGNVDADDMMKMKEKLQSNSGYKALTEMMKRYSRIK